MDLSEVERRFLEAQHRAMSQATAAQREKDDFVAASKREFQDLWEAVSQIGAAASASSSNYRVTAEFGEPIMEPTRRELPGVITARKAGGAECAVAFKITGNVLSVDKSLAVGGEVVGGTKDVEDFAIRLANLLGGFFGS